MNDENNYGGYKPKELFVKKQYMDYKEEILQHFDMQTFNEKIMNKAKEYMTSEKVKSTYAGPRSLMGALHYDISFGAPMTIHQLISIILYCDMDKYSTKFSESFRKLYPQETIHSVKKRNSAFWWQSKHFKEIVQLFGVSGVKDHPRGTEKGPFCMCSISSALFNYLHLHIPYNRFRSELCITCDTIQYTIIFTNKYFKTS